MLEIKVTIGLEPKTVETLATLIAAATGAKTVSADSQKVEAAEPVKQPKKAATVPVEETGDQVANATVEANSKPKAEPKVATLDIEDVRAILADAKHKHGLPKVKAVLKKYGAGDLGSVPADKYDELVADIKTIGG